jgi:3-hydroxymyristoyl/3-hydroxydecanoyl-(acyl carrier protein) dehydratase
MTLLQRPVCIAVDHPALPGHFPGHPLVPGAVLLDEVLNAIDTSRAADASGAGDAGWRIDAVKFHRPARPGQQLQLECRPAPGGGHAFELRADGQLYVSGTVRA